jgi:hypothetical protein
VTLSAIFNDAENPEFPYMQGQLLNPSIFFHNSFGLDGDQGVGLFVHGSRFNHACIPNCIRVYVKEHGLLVFSTCKSIAAGAEITISYGVDETFMRPRAEFRNFSMMAWGFNCSCPVCSGPAFFQQCAVIRNRLDAITEFKGLEIFKNVNRIMDLRDHVLMLMDQIDPGFYHELKADLYEHQFDCALWKRSTLKQASYYAAKYLEMWEHRIGGSTIEPHHISEARLMVEHPERDRSYLLLENGGPKHRGREQKKKPTK